MAAHIACGPIAQRRWRSANHRTKMLHCSAIAATSEICDDVLTTLSTLRETRFKSEFRQEGPWTVLRLYGLARPSPGTSRFASHASWGAALADVAFAPLHHHTGDTSSTTRITAAALRPKFGQAITAIGQGVLFCRPRRARCASPRAIRAQSTNQRGLAMHSLSLIHISEPTRPY